MNFETQDLRKIAAGLITLLVLTAVGAAAVYWTLGQAASAKRDYGLSQARFAEADRKLREVNREEEEIRANTALYTALESRGIIGPEQRLEWVELIAGIRKSRRLFDLDYEFSPQQALAGSTAPYRFNASTMKFRLPLLHEGDLFRLLEDIQGRAPAHVQPRQCSLERIGGAGLSNLAPHLAGSCTLQWITITNESSAGSRS